MPKLCLMAIQMNQLLRVATTHLKRTKRKKGILGKFALNSKMPMSQEKFLLNKVNKQEFLQHLTKYMNCHGIKSVHSYAGDYLLIARTAVERSCSGNIVVIGKDTDLLILLIHHYTNQRENSLCFTCSGERNFRPKKIYDITYM